MNVQIEKLEKNMAKLTIEVPAEDFTAALEKTYRENRNRFNVPGFRKGKAPRKMIQKLYGEGIFYEEAANKTVQSEYPKAAGECEEVIVSRPEIDLVQIEEGKPFIFTAEVALKPEVTLGEYKGVKISRTPADVSEEEVDAEIEKERDKNAREIDVDDRPVENGDLIKLDFEGFVDGEPFEGGKADDYPLTIGSGSFIPGFEEQLIGKNIGEDVDVNVTFPDNYQEEALKGKDATFKCKVNSIRVKELPDLDDDFAQDVSEFDTFVEYRDDVRTKLIGEKEKNARRTKENKAVEKAVANAQMDIPEPMIEEQLRRMLDDFSQRVQSQGMTLDQYMQMTNMTVDSFNQQMHPEALRQIKVSLLLEAVAKAESLEASDEQVDEEIKNMAESYDMEADELKEILGSYQIEEMKSDITFQMAVDLITDEAVESDEEEPVTEDILLDGENEPATEEISLEGGEVPDVEEISLDGVTEQDIEEVSLGESIPET